MKQLFPQSMLREGGAKLQYCGYDGMTDMYMYGVWGYYKREW